MARLPSITIEGHIGNEPELRYTQGDDGMAITNINVAITERKRNGNEWEDGNTTWYRCVAFRDLAENIVDSLSKGDLVLVTGRIKLDEWEDKEGEKRSTLEMLIDSCGPSLARATAEVTKTTKNSGGAPAAKPDSAYSEEPY